MDPYLDINKGFIDQNNSTNNRNIAQSLISQSTPVLQSNLQSKNSTPLNEPSQKRTSFLKNILSGIAIHSGKTGLKYGCILLAFLLFIPTLCITSVFAFKYFTKQTTKSVSDSLPWNSPAKQEADDQKFKKPEKINKSVIVDKVEWKLLDAKIVDTKLPGDTGEDDYCKPGDGNKFIYVKYSIRNVDRPFVTVPKNWVDIYDSSETKFPASTRTNKCLDLGTTTKDKYVPDILTRDEKKEYEVLFLVPKDKKDFRMKVGDLSTIGKSFDYISLGV